jgi:hypothetical protein
VVASNMPVAAASVSIPTKWISRAAFLIWLALSAAQTGWPPLTEFAWAYNLWGYFPSWAGGLVQGAALALCFAKVREIAAGVARTVSARFAELPPWTGDTLVFCAVVAVMWLMRERILIGDSWLLIDSARQGWLFVFPDVGATFLIRTIVHADIIPIGDEARLQLAYCLCGGLATLLAMRVGRRLGSGMAGGTAIIVLLLLTGGLARVFAGHVETYSFVLCAILFYFWMALAYLDGEVAWWLPCAALGLAGWLHLSALFLVPSLALLPRFAAPTRSGRDWITTLALGAPIAMAPMIAFWLVAIGLGYGEDVDRALHVVTEVIAGEKTESGQNKQWWVRVGDEPAEVGLDYVFLSRSHLKYLANAAHLLMPFSALIIAGIALRRRAAFGTPIARLLVAAALPTLVYAFMLRPFWGPFDWDLFAITACCASLLAGHLLVTSLELETRTHVATCLIGFQILFVGLPFLVLGVVQPLDGGPFIGKKYVRTIMDLRPGQRPVGALVPWL